MFDRMVVGHKALNIFLQVTRCKQNNRERIPIDYLRIFFLDKKMMNKWNQKSGEVIEKKKGRKGREGDVISLNLYVYAYFTKRKKR